MAEDDKYLLGKQGERRMKGRTITVPVVTGTCAFYLGKKVRRGMVPRRADGACRHAAAQAEARRSLPPAVPAAGLQCLKLVQWD